MIGRTINETTWKKITMLISFEADLYTNVTIEHDKFWILY